MEEIAESMREREVVEEVGEKKAAAMFEDQGCHRQWVYGRPCSDVSMWDLT